jgi:YD repeat-containing protein
MKSRRSKFAFAVQLIPIFLLLMFVAPQLSAQQDENHSSEPSSAPKAASNQRPAANPRPGTSHGNDKPDKRAAGQRSPSTNAPRQSGSSTDAATSDPGPANNKPGRRGSSTNAPGRSGSSTDAAAADPGPSNNKPGRRGSSTNAPGRSGSSTDAAAADPGPSNNKPGRRGSSTNASGRSGSSTDTVAADPGPSISKPGRQGSSTNAPGRTGSSTDAANDNSPATKGPGRRGSSNNAVGRTGKTTDTGEKNASDNGQPSSTRPASSRSTRANGTVVERDKSGRTTSVTTPRGTTAKMDRSGRVTSIRDKGGNTISRGPRGERKVETVRPDRTRVVSLGQRGGYVERPFNRDGRQYLRRTYVVGGHSYVHVYRGHYYHGVPYYVYVPPYYYAPAYYGWVFNPWPRPVYYRWGWYGSSWYRPYGYYFAPYPVYPYASLWLTDYLLAENLRLAYENEQLNGYQPDDTQAATVLAAYHPAGQASGDQAKTSPVVLTPEVKQMIADEVKTVIADQQKASSSPRTSSASSTDELPAALDSSHRVFVVSSLLEATANGETCSLTSSDVVMRIEDDPDSDNTVAVRILASKKSDCAIGSQVRLELTDLNDMLNHLREQVDTGMKILSEKQGKDGLPVAPAANPRAVAEGIAAPDPTAAADLQKQEQEADQTEKEVQQEASSDSGAEN